MPDYEVTIRAEDDETGSIKRVMPIKGAEDEEAAENQALDWFEVNVPAQEMWVEEVKLVSRKDVAQ